MSANQPAQAIPKLLVRPAEAARMLSLDRSTLYAYLMSGSIPSFCVGRARLISVRALTEWIARQEGRTPEDESSAPTVPLRKGVVA
jgi:excisionase family DNA binding protein